MGREENGSTDLSRPGEVKLSSSITVLDLFSGAGGLSLGFERAGYTVLGGIDFDKNSVKTYRYNFGERKGIKADIREIRDPRKFLSTKIGTERVDVISAGLPCQTFSRVGRIKLRSLGRDPAKDPRTYLFWHFLRFLEELQPYGFLVENVPDMLGMPVNGSAVPEIIKEKAEDLGYTVDWRILNAADYGVPQRRRRLFIVGTRCSSRIRWPLGITRNHVTVWEAISDLPRIKAGFKKNPIRYVPVTNNLTPYQREMRRGAPPLLYNHVTRSHREDDLMIFRMLPEGGKYTDIPPHLRRYSTDKFKDRYRKLKKSEPSWTIEAHIFKDSYRYIYPSTPYSNEEPHRTISVREAARLQSFPDGFIFPVSMTEAFRQIGNAVPPLLAEALARSLTRMLK